MPPRNPELPEGTDHIINGAMETGGGTTGGIGGTASASAGGGSGSGFVGSASGDDTGGTAGSMGVGSSTGSSGLGSAGSTGSSSGGSGSVGFGGGSSAGGSGADIKTQLRDGVSSIQQQAGDRVREFAETGKERATGALEDLSKLVGDAADSIDERLGSEYGEYARRAADAVSGLADTLRERDVDQLFDDGRNLVRKSPGVALGAAAVIGFTLVRLIKSGMDDNRSEREVEFQPDPALGDNTGIAVARPGSSGSGSASGI